MSAIAIEEAEGHLSEIVAKLLPGEEIILTRNDLPVARLIGASAPQPTAKPPRKLGTMKGSVLYMAPDFDAPLDDFKEYME